MPKPNATAEIKGRQLAREAATVTDKEMAMLDMKRQTLHNERKEKRRSMTFGFLGDHNHGRKPMTLNAKTDYKTQTEDDLPTIEQSYQEYATKYPRHGQP